MFCLDPGLPLSSIRTPRPHVLLTVTLTEVNHCSSHIESITARPSSSIITAAALLAFVRRWFVTGCHHSTTTTTTTTTTIGRINQEGGLQTDMGTMCAAAAACWAPMVPGPIIGVFGTLKATSLRSERASKHALSSLQATHDSSPHSHFTLERLAGSHESSMSISKHRSSSSLERIGAEGARRTSTRFLLFEIPPLTLDMAPWEPGRLLESGLREKFAAVNAATSSGESGWNEDE